MSALIVGWLPAPVNERPDRYQETLRGFGLGGEDVAAWRGSGLPEDAFDDWLIDRVARRPTGSRARRVYSAEDVHDFARFAILEALALGAGDHLLEIGCGGGCCCATRCEPAAGQPGSITATRWFSWRASELPAQRLCSPKRSGCRSPTTHSARWRCPSSSSSSMTPLPCCESVAAFCAEASVWPFTQRRLSYVAHRLRPSRWPAIVTSTQTRSYVSWRAVPSSGA